MCSYGRTPPPLSPSQGSTGTVDSTASVSAEEWRRAPRALPPNSSPPSLRDRGLAPRNGIFIGPTMAQTILMRCSSSDEEAEEDDPRELCTAAGAEEEEGDQSRTDASEDSIEVRVLPIAPNPQSSLLQKNKRKLVEPRKVSGSCKAIARENREAARHRLSRVRHCSRLPRAPGESSSVKKHFSLAHVYHPRDPQIPQTTLCPFRPWSSETLRQRSVATPTELTPPSSNDGFSAQDLPAARLELRDEAQPSPGRPPSPPPSANYSSVWRQDADIPEVKTREDRWEAREDSVFRDRDERTSGDFLSRQPTADSCRVSETSSLRPERRSGDPENRMEEDEDCEGETPVETASTSAAVNVANESSTSSQQSGVVNLSSSSKDAGDQKSHLRNYKNMTRERRMEANARERTRVHTISAAFDTLRRAVPAYAHNQRLSKLSVLRIACAYIVTLSRVAGKDYSAANDAPSLAECVDTVTRTIQTEGKVRRRRDE